MENFLYMIAGSVISVWSGLAMARYLHFIEQRQTAIRIVVRLLDLFEAMMKEETETDAANRCTMIFVDPASNLIDMGFRGSADYLTKMSFRLQDSLMDHWRAERDARKDRDVRKMHAVLESLGAMQKELIGGIQRIPINRVVLIFGDRCGLIYAKVVDRARKMQAYLNGHAEDWK